MTDKKGRFVELEVSAIKVQDGGNPRTKFKEDSLFELGEHVNPLAKLLRHRRRHSSCGHLNLRSTIA